MLMSYKQIESSIRAPVLFVAKKDQMLGKPRILSLFFNPFDNFKT